MIKGRDKGKRKQNNKDLKWNEWEDRGEKKKRKKEREK